MPAEGRVCVVEDDESLRAALLSLLRSLGHEAEGYSSAELYLQRDNAASPACLITDIHLPGLSGIELTRRLRTLGDPVPVIMITARSETVLEDEARASGATCFLKKPFEAEALISCLGRALRTAGA